MEPGTYALLFESPEAVRLSIGALGTHDLPAGWYVYVGSALGPGGLGGRLNRHLGAQKRLHWHVDYLAARLAVARVYFVAAPTRLECRWAQRLLAQPAACAPIPRFGSSDCAAGCPAHLVRLPAGLDVNRARALISEATQGEQAGARGR